MWRFEEASTELIGFYKTLMYLQSNYGRAERHTHILAKPMGFDFTQRHRRLGHVDSA